MTGRFLSIALEHDAKLVAKLANALNMQAANDDDTELAEHIEALADMEDERHARSIW